MRRIAALLRSDVRNIVRDPILVAVSCVPFIIIALLRFGVPALTNVLRGTFDLAPYHGLIFSFFLQLTPYMYGLVIGLMLLDERDEHLLTAISVTPLTRSGFLLYRLAMPVGFGLIVSYPMLYLTGLIHVPVGHFTLVALLAAFQAPINAMLLVAFARNKVEGMAVAKAGGVLLMAPLAIAFLDPPTQFTGGIAPTFWVSKALLEAAAGRDAFWWIVIAGALVNTAYLFLLGRRFAKRAG